jgi:predicted aspartyl protease
MGIRRGWMVLWILLIVPVARGGSWQGEIPFKLVQGFGIVVKGGIGPADNLNLLFDTGAVPSVISQRVASRIGVAGTRGSFSLVSRDVEAQYATVSDVRFGSIRAARLSMVVVDLGHLEELLGVRTDAIVGLDLLSGQNFAIDYKHKKILSELSGLTLHETPVEIRSVAGAPYWVFTANVAGHAFRMLLDTGANDVAVFPSRMAGLVSRSGAQREVSARLTGETAPGALEPQAMTVGDMQFKRQKIDVLALSSLASQQVDGLVGPRVLGMSRVEFDWEHRCIRWDRE